MEFNEALVRRRMVRAFTPEPVERDTVTRLLDLARRAPSAGNTQATAFVVLEGPAQTERYWDVTLAGEGRALFPLPGLLVAPVLVVVWCSPASYVTRYDETDKVGTGLGTGVDAWTVPYWFVDGGMVVQNLLVAVVDAGLGACFFGLFDHEDAVRTALDVPAAWRALGTVALGHRAPDPPRGSARRPRPPIEDVLHRGRW